LEIVVVLIVVILALLLAGSLIGLAFELFWLVVTGLIVGGLGRLVLPGRQEIGLLTTALVGIAASLLGGILADLFDAGWLVKLLVAIALAAIGITLLSGTEGRPGPRPRVSARRPSGRPRRRPARAAGGCARPAAGAS
jgi:uncharacterized membrane protein YeaQ/YmgE (transglycosylase-associated protein family)